MRNLPAHGTAPSLHPLRFPRYARRTQRCVRRRRQPGDSMIACSDDKRFLSASVLPELEGMVRRAGFLTRAACAVRKADGGIVYYADGFEAYLEDLFCDIDDLCNRVTTYIREGK